MILDRLRKSMKEKNIDYYIVPTLDPHSCEYLPDYFKEREFLTGFTGSAGTALVGEKTAYLWTDGRYYIQAESEIKGYGFDLQRQGAEGVLSLEDWLYNNIKKNQKIALNGLYFLESAYENLEKKLKDKDAEIIDMDLIGALWEDRPEFPMSKAYILDEKYAGESRESKLMRIRKILGEKGCDLSILTNLDDICWILNIRGGDILYTPLLLSYLIIEDDKAILYVQKEKAEDIKGPLKDICIIKEYEKFYEDLEKYKNKKIYIDKKRVNHKCYSLLEKNNFMVSGENISLNLKAIKNEIELKNQRDTYVRDGLALTKYIYWLKNRVKDGPIGEYDAQLRLDEFRAEDSLYIYNSFETISAYGSNAAMMHYSASKKNQSLIENKGFYLVDSGGQYFTGTTDVTRTIALGEVTEEEKIDFTLTLKCHLNLMDAVFLKGTKDLQLDTLTRMELWKHHLDYKCGTGHGVGYFLSVHEDPPRISPGSKGRAMEVGMVVSNEPGVYKEGKYGIRIENIMEVVEDGKYPDGSFYKFFIMSLCPIEIESIKIEMLTDRQLEILNGYHKNVYEKLSKYLSGDILKWLKEVTRKLERWNFEGCKGKAIAASWQAGRIYNEKFNRWNNLCRQG